MTREAAEKAIRSSGAIVILRGISELSKLEKTVDTLCGIGFTVVEITLNSPSALSSISRLRERLGDLAVIGAGTVRTAENARDALEAGSQFLVAPCLDRDSIRFAMEANVLLVPGVFTPTEAQAAHSMGCRLLKLFPSNQLGPEYLKAILAPLNDISFIPTGGVDATNAEAFFGAGAVALGLGSSLTGHKDLEAMVREGKRLRNVIDACRTKHTESTT